MMPDGLVHADRYAASANDNGKAMAFRRPPARWVMIQMLRFVLFALASAFLAIAAALIMNTRLKAYSRSVFRRGLIGWIRKRDEFRIQ